MGEASVRFLRSERENDFSETGGPPSATEPAFFDSTASGPVAGGREENAVSYRQKRRTERRVMGTEPGARTERGKEKCYLFAGDNNAAATAAPFFPSPSATRKCRRTHCDSAATNTSA